jgi:hypothetical protein
LFKFSTLTFQITNTPFYKKEHREYNFSHYTQQWNSRCEFLSRVSTILIIVHMMPEIEFGSQLHMLPLQKNWILKKIWKTILHIHLHNMCVRQVSWVSTILYDLCKKEKIYLLKTHTFSIEFCIFYTLHTTIRFCMKWLCESVSREDICAIFCFSFFNSKICVTCISK